MTRDEVLEICEGAAVYDGFDDAIIGYLEQYGRPPIILYDREKCIDILMTRDGMEHDVAEEYFQFNTIGAYVGEGTPAFATLMEKD